MSEHTIDIREQSSVVVALDHNTAALALGLSPSRLREHVRLGELTPHFSGTKPIYLIADLAQFVEQLPTFPSHLTSTHTGN